MLKFGLLSPKIPDLILARFLVVAVEVIHEHSVIEQVQVHDYFVV